MNDIITMSTEILDTISLLPCNISSLNDKAKFAMTSDPLNHHYGIEVELNHVLMTIAGDGFVFFKNKETGTELMWDSHEQDSEKTFRSKLDMVADGKDYRF